jgi:caffeoyl-CoA O-methyltransferase
LSSKHTPLSDELAAYVREVSLREPELFRRLRQETAQLPLARMQITPEQGQFMALLVKLLGARRTLEIGVFTGYSTLAVAAALPEDGQVVACDVSEEWTAIARRYWAEAGVAHKIDLRLAPAQQTLDHLLAEGRQESFDFVFIDADKENYEAYYECGLHLLRRGGLIGIDNVLWHGQVADPSRTDAETEAIRSLNLKLRDDERVDISLIPIGDGLTLARKR